MSSEPFANPSHAGAVSLDSLRGQIDQIDDRILALLGERAALAQALRAAKQATASQGLPIRPAREVTLLRRLIAQAPKDVERDLILEVWRALISANVRRQADLDVVVAGATDAVRQFDLARRHFGAGAQIGRAEDARAAMARLLEPSPAVAVLPWPGASGPGGWWPILAESRFHRLGVIGGLPIAASAAGEEPEAAILAADPVFEPAGDDCALAIAFDPHYRCARALSDAQLAGKEIARARTLVLIRLDTHVTADDLRLQAALRAGLEGLRIVGGYARI